MGLNINKNQLCCCSLRRHSSRTHCKCVGHDQTILHETPLEVASHAQATQAAKINNSKDSISQGVVFIPFYKLATGKGASTRSTSAVTKKDKRTAELYSEQGNTDFTEVTVIDEITQCENYKEHIAKGRYFCIRGSIL